MTTTSQRISELCREAHEHGKSWSACYVGNETAIVVVENPERVEPSGKELVPGFYVAKYHKGVLVRELFV